MKKLVVLKKIDISFWDVNELIVFIIIGLEWSKGQADTTSIVEWRVIVILKKSVPMTNHDVFRND